MIAVLARRRGIGATLSLAILVGLSLYFACLYQDDFRVYQAGAHTLFSHTLYSHLTRGEFFTYPPFAAVVFLPFGSIPSPLAAQILWALLNDGALVGLLAISIRACLPELPKKSLWLWVTGLCAPALFLDPVLSSIRNGQIDVMLTALVVWDLARSRSPGRNSLPLGVGTGLAAAIKLTALIFIPYLLLTKRFRAAMNCAGTFALCEGIAFLFSPRSSVSYWTHHVFEYTRVGGYLGLRGLLATTNQSLLGALARINHDTVSSGVLWTMSVLLGVAGLGLAARVHYRWSSFAGIVVCATTGLLVSPVTWTHEMVWIVPAIAWLACSRELPRWGRAMAVVTALLFWIAPVWWVPTEILGPRVFVAGDFFFFWIVQPLRENGWQLVAGNSFFIWMVVLLVSVAGTLFWHWRSTARAPAVNRSP
ncbi:MAG TPA: glycosyltransferase 87 family protein [Acidimicrobiales bacterium]|nr:glycosyltransferase 87 family protein [Acidimicrobiales bacterium]